MKYLRHLFTALLLLCATVANAVTYPDWKSTNKTDSSTSSNTYTIQAERGSLLSFNWEVSSEYHYDRLIVMIDGVQVLNKSGYYSGSYKYIFSTSGTHTLLVKYTKDFYRTPIEYNTDSLRAGLPPSLFLPELSVTTPSIITQI